MRLRSAIAAVSIVLAALGCGSSTKAPDAPPSSATTTSDGKSASAPTTNAFSFEAKNIDGQNVRLDTYAGKVLLVVNVASKCGFTPQYEALEALNKKHASAGLAILAFPSDQFGHQEPGTESEIKTFCATRYSVTFPLFAKVDVNGPNAHPFYKWMRAEQPGSFRADSPGAEKLYEHLQKTTPEVLGTDAVKWNFTKFLVDRKGKVVKRFESMETPESIEGDIVAQLGAR
jgi:glutathione peroxidase